MRNRKGKICAAAEKFGWTCEMEGGKLAVSASARSLGLTDGSTAKNNFVYKVVLPSPETAQKDISTEYERFDADRFAYLLQKDYIREYPEDVIPPVLAISEFTEYLENAMSALKWAFDTYADDIAGEFWPERCDEPEDEKDEEWIPLF